MPDLGPEDYRPVRVFATRPVAAAYAALLTRLYDFNAAQGEKFVVRENHKRGEVRYEVAVRKFVYLGRRKQIDSVFDTLLAMGLLAPER